MQEKIHTKVHTAEIQRSSGFLEQHKTKKLEYVTYSSFFSAPAGIRTPNLLIRSQMLYPIKLQAQNIL